jgi:hypothetical protein
LQTTHHSTHTHGSSTIHLLGKCPCGQISFWAYVFLGKRRLGKRLMSKCPSGQMSFFSWQMSFWADVFWANIFLGKCLSGQMSFRANVVWANVVWANVVSPFGSHSMDSITENCRISKKVLFYVFLKYKKSCKIIFSIASARQVSWSKFFDTYKNIYEIC